MLKTLLYCFDVLVYNFRNKKRFLPHTVFTCYSLQWRHTDVILAVGTELLMIVR